jgi:hypothetical protein
MKLLSYCNWEGRPTVLFQEDNGTLFALSRMEGRPGWTPVDANDVSVSARVLPSLAALRAWFPKTLGDAKVPSAENLMWPSPSDAK